MHREQTQSLARIDLEAGGLAQVRPQIEGRELAPIGAEPAGDPLEQTRVLASQTHCEALDAIEPLGEPAALLRQIAEFIVRRNA